MCMQLHMQTHISILLEQLQQIISHYHSRISLHLQFHTFRDIFHYLRAIPCEILSTGKDFRINANVEMKLILEGAHENAIFHQKEIYPFHSLLRKSITFQQQVKIQQKSSQSLKKTHISLQTQIHSIHQFRL